MYTREAKNRDELWLLDQIESLSIDDVAFRSRDYVIISDEKNHSKLGFGRKRIHKEHDELIFCEITSIGILDLSQTETILVYLFDSLIKSAKKDGFNSSYFFAESSDYLSILGFNLIPESELPSSVKTRFNEKQKTVSKKAVPLSLEFDSFKIPSYMQSIFNSKKSDPKPVPKITPEDFGINPKKVTSKYKIDN